MKIKVFLDANVYFSAARSLSGGSNFIIELAKEKKIKVFAAAEILKEAEKNLRLKEDFKILLRHYENIKDVSPRVVKVDKEEAKKKFGKIINEKDSSVLAGAEKAKADFLATLDRKHFFTKRVLQAKLPFEIVTPAQLIHRLKISP